MVRILAALFISIFLFSCHHGAKVPDVSDIKVPITTEHFEQDFFASDSANIANHLPQLKAKYPQFADLFFSQLIELDPRMTSTDVNVYLGGFINAYKHVYDTAEMQFKDFEPYQNEIMKSLQFVKYYFPTYNLPAKIVTYIAPVEGTGNFLAYGGIIGVGLQNYLGKNFSLYKASFVQETYPEYVSARFEPSYISVNSMKNILDDIYPEKDNDDPLVNRMVEKGKRLYVLSRFLPNKEEYKLIGYTEKQLKECYENEAKVWDLFIQNNLLQINNPDIIKKYVAEGPKTVELGEGAPGNIGSFAGWQIVKKYMQKNEKVTLQQLLSTDAETIFQDARYKP